MKMNMSKVLIGGIIAGIVQNVIDFITQKYLLGPKFMAELDAFKPGLGSGMSGENPVPWILLDLLMGIFLVWLYAAIRPRFGAGPRTAAYAAIFVWAVSGIAYYGWLSMGMMSGGLWGEFSIVALITLIISTMVGAKFYTEEAAA
jgi:hypothetical protein